MTELIHRYFEWLTSLVCYGTTNSYSKQYSRLLLYLSEIDFYWSIPMDENRYIDGGNLRDDFLDSMIDEIDPVTYDNLVLYFNDQPVSVLEVMVALAKRMEDQIMCDDEFGNRTDFWFWTMITNLGLISMDDSSYDQKIVSETIERFLNRDYKINGEGGLFSVPDTRDDLRDLEIWYQMYYYLDYILDM